jgi:hypothetical protein
MIHFIKGIPKRTIEADPGLSVRPIQISISPYKSKAKRRGRMLFRAGRIYFTAALLTLSASAHYGRITPRFPWSVMVEFRNLPVELRP